MTTFRIGQKVRWHNGRINSHKPLWYRQGVIVAMIPAGLDPMDFFRSKHTRWLRESYDVADVDVLEPKQHDTYLVAVEKGFKQKRMALVRPIVSRMEVLEEAHR